MGIINLICFKKGHQPGKSGQWANRCTRCGKKLG